MTLDSNTDKQHEQTDATPDSNSDIEATAESATPSITTTEATSDEAAAETAAASGDEPAASEAAEATTEAAEAEAADGEAADGEAADDEAETAAHAATVTSTPAAPKASMPTKAVAAVLMLAFVAAAFIFIQRSTSKGQSYNLTKHDMEVIFQEIIPPPQQSEIASTPEKKKQLVDEIRKLLSVASYAESEGYAQKPEVAGQIALQTDLALNDAYREKNPTVEVGDDEVNAYFQAHPNDFETFLQNNPRFQQQASGPNREGFKKEYGKLKVLAERARKDKLDQQDKTRLELLIKRSAVLENAYLSDLDKNSDKLVSDDEITNYYSDHLNEFEEVRARHILISTQPQPPAPGAKPGEQPKALSKDEARKKAEEVLAKVRNGEDFAALAKQYSDDPGSKDKGGEYTFGRGQMDPDFEKAAFSLKPGEVSGPVETQFGYHIIKLEERKGGAGPSDPKVRQKIVAKLKKDKIDAKIDEIAKNVNLTVPEDFDMTVKPAETPQLPAGHPSVPNQQQ
ncbi:MAG TPA: peptidylprolyl isomerase [Blastocatellia bacterium]|nr:peptidylprolyl isomerase [Blastocatellia bacterium]